MDKHDVARRIEHLDAERDHVAIVNLLAGREFPWDFTRALELALYRTYCVPSISALLDATGEFRRRGQKRYDDTSIIMSEILEWGYDAGRGREALRRMNRIHARFQIANEDFLYVLSTFLLEPVRWVERFGWRPMTAHEKRAFHAFWREVGVRMGIRDIPPDYDAFERYNVDFERAHFRYTPENRRVGEATRDIFAGWFPAALRPLTELLVYAMLDESVLDAFGFPHPTPAERALVEVALKARARVVRWLPPRRRDGFITGAPTRTYPRGYEISELGPSDPPAPPAR